MSDPPKPLELSGAKRVIEGVRGSSVWDGMAVDRQALLPDDAIVVNPGERITFRGELPDALHLTIYEEAAVRSRTMAATGSTPLSASKPTWVVSPSSGRFLAAVSRTWDDDHSVVDYFALIVE